MSDLKDLIITALRHRMKHGRHLHHSACIHNLSPTAQVEVRGKTVDWWQSMVGPLPEQITPDQWECEPPQQETDQHEVEAILETPMSACKFCESTTAITEVNGVPVCVDHVRDAVWTKPTITSSGKLNRGAPPPPEDDPNLLGFDTIEKDH